MNLEDEDVEDVIRNVRCCHGEMDKEDIDAAEQHAYDLAAVQSDLVRETSTDGSGSRRKRRASRIARETQGRYCHKFKLQKARPERKFNQEFMNSFLSQHLSKPPIGYVSVHLFDDFNWFFVKLSSSSLGEG